MPRIAVGVGVGVPFSTKKRASIFRLALGMVTDIKVFMLAKTGQLRAVGERLIGLGSNFKI